MRRALRYTPTETMNPFPLKPSSAHVKRYYAALAQFQQQGHNRGEYPLCLRRLADALCRRL
jgi:hypothetical protein